MGSIEWVAGKNDLTGAPVWRASLGALRLLAFPATRGWGEEEPVYRWDVAVLGSESVRSVGSGAVDGRGVGARSAAQAIAERVALLYSGRVDPGRGLDPLADRVEALERTQAEIVAGQSPPAWARPGTVVRYRPHVGRNPWYLGEITGEPRLLGGTWVVRLGRMEAAYHLGRGSVAAAAIDALEPVTVSLSDTETLTVTDDGGGSLTLTREDWRRVVSAHRGNDRIGGGLRWRHVAGGRTAMVTVAGTCSYPTYVDSPAVRQWVETGVYPSDGGGGE